MQGAIEQIETRGLVVYAVWEPILKTDDERSSRKTSVLFRDERVVNYWAPTQDLGRLFQGPIELEGTPAWDVYLAYPPGVIWEDDAPPKPVFFMHQLGGRLPDAKRLDGQALADALRELVP